MGPLPLCKQQVVFAPGKTVGDRWKITGLAGKQDPRELDSGVYVRWLN